LPSNRAGEKRGKQPLWLCKVMCYHVQPKARERGIDKRIGWHTFRRTYSSILKDNGEDVEVVQELLRHASTRRLRTGADAGQAGGAEQSRAHDPRSRSVYRECTANLRGIGSKFLKRFGVPIRTILNT
jgi:integrase